MFQLFFILMVHTIISMLITLSNINIQTEVTSIIIPSVQVAQIQMPNPKPAKNPTTKPEEKLNKKFDFWIGKWKATWKNADGSTGQATNEITKILNHQVIQENFQVTNDQSLKGFKGLSFSVYNPSAKVWKQTWVDNQGAYLDFYGKFEGDKRIFERKFTATTGKLKGKVVMQRMVFYNIKPQSFDWDWEASLDEGKTWKLNWRIRYTRIK